MLRRNQHNGIALSESWRDYDRFISDMGLRPKGHVIDRIDGTKGYFKWNCRWATYKLSTENRRNTVWLDNHRVNDIAQGYGIPASRIYARLSRGWTLKEIILHKNPIKHGFAKWGRNTRKRR